MNTDTNISVGLCIGAILPLRGKMCYILNLCRLNAVFLVRIGGVTEVCFSSPKNLYIFKIVLDAMLYKSFILRCENLKAFTRSIV